MKWISIKEEKPECCKDILFTEGGIVYKGWLETYEFGEELSFVEECGMHWYDDVTHWMPLPKPPKIKPQISEASQVVLEKQDDNPQ